MSTLDKGGRIDDKSQRKPGARPTNDISIEFEIRPEFGVL